MNAIIPQVYPSLLRHAALLLAGHTAAASLQPADLLHMAVERLCSRPALHIEAHPARFCGLMLTVMKRTLIDEHRKLHATRRPPPGHALPLEEAANLAVKFSTAHDIVHEALDLLAATDTAAATLLRRHWLEGRTNADLAAQSGISNASMSRRLTSALVALRRLVLENC